MRVLEIDRKPRLLTAAEYMTLDIRDRTELLGGVIYDVSPRQEPHRFAVEVLARALIRGLGDEYSVRTQDSVAVPNWRGKNAPEVDVAVLKRAFYKLGPTAKNAFAFIEVADSTYRTDRGYKMPLYVNAGVPAWLVNIALRQVEYFGSPADLLLEHGIVFTERDTLDILGVKFLVAELFEVRNEITSDTAD
jgi:hypothetical protein